jgi:hypothetical protein
MPRNLITVTVALIAFGCGVIGSTIAWSSIGTLPGQANSQTEASNPVTANRTKADFDRAFIEAQTAGMPQSQGFAGNSREAS